MKKILLAGVFLIISAFSAHAKICMALDEWNDAVKTMYLIPFINMHSSTVNPFEIYLDRNHNHYILMYFDITNKNACIIDQGSIDDISANPYATIAIEDTIK